MSKQEFPALMCREFLYNSRKVVDVSVILFYYKEKVIDEMAT